MTQPNGKDPTVQVHPLASEIVQLERAIKNLHSRCQTLRPSDPSYFVIELYRYLTWKLLSFSIPGTEQQVANSLQQIHVEALNFSGPRVLTERAKQGRMPLLLDAAGRPVQRSRS